MQTVVRRVVRKLIPRPIETPPPPVESEKAVYSALFSLFDEEGRPTQRLIDIGLDAAEKMLDVSLEEDRPGEEYRLLAGLMLTMAPRMVVVIGREESTAQRVIEKHLPQAARLVTVEPDLLDVAALVDADFILLEGPGDGDFEAWVFEELSALRFKNRPIVMLNDTRVWAMLRFCRQLKYPKLDMTSFGRWSGTLLVELP